MGDPEAVVAILEPASDSAIEIPGPARMSEPLAEPRQLPVLTITGAVPSWSRRRPRRRSCCWAG